MGGKNKRLSAAEHRAAARALEQLLAAGYVSRRALYIENFVRGIFFGLGSVIGATILIAFIIWALSLLVDVPLIGTLFRQAQQTLQQSN